MTYNSPISLKMTFINFIYILVKLKINNRKLVKKKLKK